MAKTAQELKNEAWAMLTGSGPYDTPSAEDSAVMQTYLNPLLEQLALDEVCEVTDQDDIPDAWFLPLARLLANVAGPRFGTPVNDDARRMDEALLRKLTAAPPTYEPACASYF
jgi:hypothetical protein